MTYGTIVIKNGAFNMIAEETREYYDYIINIYEEDFNEAINLLPREEFITTCKYEFECIKQQHKKNIFDKDDEDIKMLWLMTHHMKKLGVVGVVFDFIEKDYTIQKKNWSGERHVLCAGCQKVEGKLSCGRCGMKCYCSKECQLLEWKRHKQTCKEVKRNETP
jgi:hypothetical protein